MRKPLVIVLAATVILFWVGVLVFRFLKGLSWVDALFTTMTTIGFGDHNLKDGSAAIKLFGVFMMLSGAAALAAVFGIMTDLILRWRLQELFGQRRKRMRDHIVLCGLGNVGFRVLEHLRSIGEDVVVIERDDSGKFLEDARRMGVEVITGDMRLASSLDRAEIKQARCLIAVADEDLSNLEAALGARAVNENIRIVLRMFDQNLADKVRAGFGIETAFSTSALAAPAFAMSAMDPAVIGSFYIGGSLMLNMEIVVQAGSVLDGLSIAELERKGEISVLAHESVDTGDCRLHPASATLLAAGDKVIASLAPSFVRGFRELSQSA